MSGFLFSSAIILFIFCLNNVVDINNFIKIILLICTIVVDT